MAIPDYLENTVKDYADQAKAAYSAPINTATFTGSQFVAGEDPLQTQAINMAQQGVGSYSPYLRAAQAAQRTGAGQLGLAGQTLGGAYGALGQAGSALGGVGGTINQAGSTLGGVGGTINQAGSTLGQAGQSLGGIGATINQAGQSLGQAGAAYGGMGQFQAAGAGAAQGAANIAGGAAGMTGPNAYQQFMSPYQQQVIDATLAEYDKQGAAGAQQIKDAAISSGNFGGGREGAQLGEYQANRLADRAALQGSMLERGFGQANQLAQQNFANQGDLFGMQQGLGGMASNLFNQQGQMGQAQQSLAQSQLGRGSAMANLSGEQRALAQSQLGRGTAMQNLAQSQLGRGTAMQNLAQSQLGRGQAIQGLSAAQQGLAGAYGNQINQQFGLSDFQRQGMGQDISALGSMGAIRQGLNQAQLTADQQAARTGAYEPYGRLTQFGNVLTGLGGGMAGQQYQDPGSGGSPFQAALGTATGLAGLYGKIFG